MKRCVTHFVARLLALLSLLCETKGMSVCACEVDKLCNATKAEGATACATCLAKNKVALQICVKEHKNLAGWCSSPPTPPSPPGTAPNCTVFPPSPPGPPHPSPPGPPCGPDPKAWPCVKPGPTPDCPHGPTGPCREPAAPKIASGYESSNLFWPGEQDAEGMSYACTYCPMLQLVNRTRIVALGGCGKNIPGCGPDSGCNGIHISKKSRIGGVLREGTAPNCTAGCMKYSLDSGRTWSKIRRVMEYGPGGMLGYDRVSGDLLLMHVDPGHGYGYAPHPGAILQVRSTDLGFTWTKPVDISNQLGPLMSPDPHNLTERSVTSLAVGPGAGIQLSSTNKFHPNRIMWSGTHDGYGYDCIWYSDDGGKSYQLAKDATGKPAQLWGMSESALAETPDGGVIISMRNEGYHHAYPATECLEDSDCEGSNNTCIANHQGRPAKTCKYEPQKVNCNCRGKARSTDGGTTFSRVEPDPALLGPVCQATMVSVAKGPSGAGRTIFHANPGHGTDSESKSPPNGRASGTVRRSVDGGRNWEASVDINGHEGYSYSCLTEVPEPGFVGVAYETVLPGSSIRSIASANNIVFTLVPQNFSNSSHTPTITHDGKV